tara:strand:+ start:11792 stop:12469 length:678 start_codon:yes stop_codon:yes gene_type:complete
MAITTGTANVQIILDTDSKLIAKFLYFTSNGTDEADALKINVETLAARTFVLEVQNANTGVFVPGETILGQTSNATARVVEWKKAEKKLTVVNLTGNTAFTDGETIRTTLYNTSNTALKASGAQTTPPRTLDVSGIWYSVDPDMTVELGYGGVYANTTPFVAPVILLSGAGYYGKNALPGLLPNAMLNATGHVYTSTYTTTSAKAAYSVVVEFRKTKGFAGVAIP